MTPRRQTPRSVLVVLVLFLWARNGAASAPTADELRIGARLQELLRGVAGEYGEAFDADGGLVRPIELEEAGLLVAEARDLVPRLVIDVVEVDRLARAIADRAPADVVAILATGLGATITAATGIAFEQLPPGAPSPLRGATIFHDNCTGCHGLEGRGDGAEAVRLGLKPANFGDAAFVRGETPEDFFNVVTLGRRRSGMPSWSDALSVQDRWDVVRFLWTFTSPAARVTEGDRWLASACTTCGSVVGTATASTRRSDAELDGALLATAAGAQLDTSARDAVVAALRARAFDGLVATTTVAAPARLERPAREALAEVHGLLDQALAALRTGDAAATGLATDAYMRFEPYEKRVGAIEPGLVRRVEEGFVRLRQLARSTPDPVEIERLVATLHHDLELAATALDPGAGAWVRFAQSAGIILREGFEVVLVVGALVAYVRRSAQPAMLRALYAGSALGVVASAITAVALVTLLRLTPWAGEALEGAAMLLAAVVLFWVSYWLVSKAEADRWQRYIRGKVQGALTARSHTALGTAAFLAVYREGFETILFYQALFASTPAGDVMVPAGLVAGLALLAMVYVGFEKIGLRVPMGAFFVWTGGFLYAMAVVFAGRGVAELQEAGLVSLTPVSGAPRVEALGIFPTVESLAAQGIFLVLLAYAIGVTVARRRSARSATGATSAAAPLASSGKVAQH